MKFETVSSNPAARVTYSRNVFICKENSVWLCAKDAAPRGGAGVLEPALTGEIGGLFLREHRGIAPPHLNEVAF